MDGSLHTKINVFQGECSWFKLNLLSFSASSWTLLGFALIPFFGPIADLWLSNSRRAKRQKQRVSMKCQSTSVIQQDSPASPLGVHRCRCVVHQLLLSLRGQPAINRPPHSFPSQTSITVSSRSASVSEKLYIYLSLTPTLTLVRYRLTVVWLAAQLLGN